MCVRWLGMFKRDKDATAKTKASMRGKEVKALKARLRTLFAIPAGERGSMGGDGREGEEDGEEEVRGGGGDAWLEALTEGAMEVWKVGVGDRRTTCVAADGVPVLFDAEPPAKGGGRAGGEAWCPTLEALWRVPGLLPAFMVPYQVTKYVCQGADLMLPGTRGVSRRVARGQLCAVVAQGNPMPVAVGIADVDSDAVDVSGGGRGRAVAVLHWYGDMLWQIGLNARVPNAGFRPGFVKALDAGREEEDDKEVEGKEVEVEDADEGRPPILETDGGAATLSSSVDDRESEGEGGSAAEAKAEMGSLLEKCLLQVIRTRAVRESQLPLDAALFYSGFMRPLRPRGTNLDVKMSSYKKLVTFLKAMEFHGVVMLKQQPGGQTLITDLDSRHERVRDHVPWENTEEEHAAQVGDAAPGGAPLAGHSSGGGGAGARVRVESLCKPHAHMRAVWDALGLSTDHYLTHEECKDVLRTYVRDVIGYVGKGGGELVLDTALTDALFGGVPAEKLPGGVVPARMGLKSLSRTFDSRLQEATRVTGGTFGPHKSKIYKGQPPAIKLRPAKRRNHNVTIVSGLEQYGIDPHAYADELAKLVAASCSVDEIETVHENTKTRGEVIVGGHREKTVAHHLAAEFGIPARALSIQSAGKKNSEKARDVLSMK